MIEIVNVAVDMKTRFLLCKEPRFGLFNSPLSWRSAIRQAIEEGLKNQPQQTEFEDWQTASSSGI